MSGNLTCRIDARLSTQEAKWLDVFADRRGLKRSAAIREVVRLAYLDEFRDASRRIAALEAEVDALKGRVGALEAARRREHAARRRWARVASKRGYAEELAQRDAVIRRLQDALASLEVGRVA